MEIVQKPKIDFSRERNLLQLVNDSMRFIGKNFRPLFQSIYCLIIPFTLLISGFIFLPDKVRAAPLLYDMVAIIYKIKASLGFNPLYLIAIVYLECIVIYNYMHIYNQNSAETVITWMDIFKKTKGNLLSLFSMLIILLVGFSCIVLAFMYLDTDMTDIFGFSLFYILAVFVPFLCYFLLSALFLGLSDNFNLIHAAHRVRANFKNHTHIWINTAAILVGLIVLQKMITTTFAALYNLFPIEFFIKIFPVANIIEQLVTAGIIAIFVVISAFSYMSQEENVKGKKLLSRIDEIK
ncbi:MAG: hypothetical protein V4580_15430 [Bacteroidota bacterium]